MNDMSSAFQGISSNESSSSRFTSGTALVLYVLLARAALYLIAAANYGYFRDELYYIACGEHPGWGYVDQPPLVCWVAWLLQHTIGTSLYALRLLPMLAHAGTIILTAVLARDLGGKRWAMFLSSVSVLVAPIILGMTHFFTMNALDFLLWTLLAWVLVRLIHSGNERLWLCWGIILGVSLLNKYAVAFFAVSLFAGVLATPLRRSLARPWFWGGAALAAIIALPNFLWQWRHGFPFLELMANVRQHGRDVIHDPLSFLGQQAFIIGFIPALLVMLGVWFLFSGKARAYAVLAWGFLGVLGLIILLKGKIYYVAPAYPMMLACGAVGFERLTERGRGRWLRTAYAFLAIVLGALMAPMIFPVLPLESYITFTQRFGIEQPKIEHQPEGRLPQIYADMFGWEERVRIVADYYHSLSPEEQKVTAIGAPNYGQAGAIDFFGPKYGLPKAICSHQSYWFWGPRQYTGESIILLNEGDPQKYETACQSFTLVTRPENPYARPDENRPIYHCRGLKMSLQELWPKVRHFD
jgi:hypothetical protein